MFHLSGVTQILSTDLSAVLIERMTERARKEGLPSSLEWRVADFTALPMAASEFDVVIEKGGIDCLLTGVRDPWSLPPDVQATCKSVISEAHRVLRASGVFISITFSAPHFRQQLLYDGAFDWVASHDTFNDGDSLHYYLYAARRGLKAADEAPLDEAAKAAPSFVPAEPMTHAHMDDADAFLSSVGGSDGELP